jgi:hypothetical protein
MLGIEGRPLEHRCQARLDLADMLAVQQLHLHPAPALQGELLLGRGEGGLGAIDAEPARVADHMGDSRRLGQRPIGIAAAQRQFAQRDGAGLDPGGPAGGDEAQQPGGDSGQIAPADRQRPQRIAQHARDAPEDARHGHRLAGARGDDGGIAHGGALARRPVVDQGDAMAVTLQIERRRHADDAGADDGEMAGLGIHGMKART